MIQLDYNILYNIIYTNKKLKKYAQWTRLESFRQFNSIHYHDNVFRNIPNNCTNKLGFDSILYWDFRTNFFLASHVCAYTKQETILY